MVLTAAQITAFFQEPTQMAIPAASRNALTNEGIEHPNDLLDFDKTSISEMAANFRRSNPVVVFGAKSQKRLTAACELVKFYQAINRPLSAALLQWNPVISNFEVQYKALIEAKSQDEPDTPKISPRSLPVMKWIEAFRDVLHRCLGVRNIPLSYVIRETETPPPIGPTAQNMPHSEEGGSIEQDLITYASHNHPNFTRDNSLVYGKIEEATRGTQQAPTIKPYQRRRNGRGAFMAIVAQYAGDDKWTLEIQTNDDFLHSGKWKGTGNFTLERFVAQHRNAYSQLQLAGEHVPFQLPEEMTRVDYLLNAIVTTDPTLLAAMARIKTDTDPNGPRFQFEPAATQLIQADPVAKRLNQKKRPAAEIAGTEASEANTLMPTLKSGIGTTGVHFRFHSDEEYSNLTREQKDELTRWRATPEGAAATRKEKSEGRNKRGNKRRRTKQFKKAVAKAAAAKIAAATAKREAESTKKEEMKDAFVEALTTVVSEAESTDATRKPLNAAALVSILKKVKNK